MPEEIASAVISIREEGSNEVASALDGISGGLTAVAGVAAGVAVAGFVALAGAIGFSVSEAMAAEQIMAQTNAVIESTAGIAGMTADEITSLAGSLSEVTTFSDDAIQSAENLLLTFTNIGEDVFPDATATALDLATALGMDLNSAAMMIGKALNDPIAGLTAMGRAGVQFTDAQKTMIETMVEAGDVAGAQALIMEELNRQVGGSAEAAANTAAGQWQIFKNQMGNVAEEIGMTFLPGLTDLAGMLKGPLLGAVSSIVPFFTSMADRIDLFTRAVEGGMEPANAFALSVRAMLPEGLREGWDAVTSALLPVADAMSYFVSAVQNGIDPMTALELAIQSLVPPGGLSEMLAGIVPPDLAIALEDLVGAFGEFGAMLQGLAPEMQAGAAQIGASLSTLAPALTTVVENVATAVRGLATIWETIGPAVITGVTFVVQTIIAGVAGLAVLISGAVAAFTQILTGDFEGAWNTIVGTLETFVGTVTSIFGQSLPEFVQTWSNNWMMFQQILNEASAAIITGVTNLVSNMSNSLTSGLETTLSRIRGMISMFVDVGRQIVQGMIDGMAALANAFIEKLVNMVLAAVDAATSVLGIQSPSKVTMEMGQNVGQGFAIGMDSQAANVASSFMGLAAPIMGGAPISFPAPALPAMPGTSSGGSTPIHLTLDIPVMLDGREVGRLAYDGLVEEAQMRGMQLVPVS